MIGAVVLAAGAATRFGSPKQRLLLEEVLGRVRASCVENVVVLVDIGDFTYQDAAQILDIPIGTVMSRLHRGRRILKRELADRAMGEA